MEKTDKKEALSCAGCLNDIADNDFVAALGQDWHKDCFRCSVCDSLLSTWYFEKSGLLFCQNDYWSRYGECCQQCAQVITGPVMAAGEHRFHPECFTCVACGSHIEDTEPYALLERSKLYCGSCYSDGEDLSACTVSPANGSHAIRSVHIPAGGFRAAFSDAGDLRVTQIDSSCGLLALHIGDRILEINGAPVRRQLDDIDRALHEPDTVIQLTIEHNPETTNNKNIPMCNLQTDIDREHDHRHKLSIQNDNKTSKAHIPDISCNLAYDQRQESKETEIEEGAGKKERLFKRKVDNAGKGRVIKRRQTPSSPLLGDKERSSSMSKLLDVVDGGNSGGAGVLCDLSRARSFRVPEPGAGQKVFRACDLLQGELLGSGFFGQVYKVTHRDTNEVMVLKQLYRLDEDAQNNFLKEVAVLRSLQHPNVLRFVGVLYKDKRLHLVTEYVAGGTLYQLLQDKTIELSWSERARLARDVAAGVGYLHRMNVIHRDLNSHNCLVREDKTVIVADFGLARIVQRTASSTLERQRSHSTLRRKRYTVVGNPYWMAPEMMNGNVYDEKVDVFSFGIILCEIIGRVSADPDFLPRRMDFGLNEVQFLEQFCRGAPEPFYRIAFLACDLDPDHRPKFEVIEIWLESLVMHLSKDRPIPADLLADILQYARGVTEIGHATPECCQLHVNSIFCTGAEECCQHKKCGGCEKLRRSPSKVASLELTLTEGGVIKSKSNATMVDQGEESNGQPSSVALGKCVSASHIWQALRPMVTVTNLSRSHHTLTGYILRADADGKNINITKVDDITKWLDPPQQLKRISPDSQLNNIVQEHISKARRFEEKQSEQYENNLPSFMRNQSVEGLESKYKNEVDAPLPFCRHFSIPGNCEVQDEGNDSDSSDEDLTVSNWYKNVSTFKMDVDQPTHAKAAVVKKGENLKKSSYDISDVTLRNPEYLEGERKINEADSRRFNIDYLTKNPMMAVGIKNIPKLVEQSKEKSPEKTNFFAKKLLSPKLSRLFKPNTAEVVRNKTDSSDNNDDKSRSKFFIQRSLSPTCKSTYRVRPINDDKKLPSTDKKSHENNLLKSDIKLASMGKPMTPIFRRHIPTEKPEFADGRFSYRDRRSKFDTKANQDTKFVELGRNRIKAPLGAVEKNVKLAPLIRCSQSDNIPALTTVLEKKTNKLDCKELAKNDKDVTTHKRREPGISRSNYVSLANLKINSKIKEMDKDKKDESIAINNSPPFERVL